ncbi:MAG: hypothetical protein WDZ41_04550 [Candidatus Babeliales bacterium]
MKKLTLALVFIFLGLAVTEASARYRECGWRKCYDRCEPACPVVERACPPSRACKVDKIVEEPCPAVPCCVRYVRVEEPAIITKHVSYSAECPTGCTQEQIDAGMMKAGETWDYAK